MRSFSSVAVENLSGVTAIAAGAAVLERKAVRTPRHNGPRLERTVTQLTIMVRAPGPHSAIALESQARPQRLCQQSR
jgi:hypothetical protein